MVRQISVLPAASTSQAPEGEEGADLADWLSRDLRAKGTPSRPPPTDVPPPADPETSALVGWLARDLTPKHSVRPQAPASPAAQLPAAQLPVSVPPAAEPPAAEPEPLPRDTAPIPPLPFAAIEAMPVAPSVAAAPGASDARTTVPPVEAVAPELALAAHGVAAPPSPDEPSALASELQEDDLSVLPGRRRTVVPGGGKEKRRKYAALLLAALLLGGGALLLRRGSSSAGEGVAAAAAAAPAEAAAALLPPPPDEAAPVELPAEPATAPRHRAGTAQPEEDPGLADPRSFLGGPSVRRYADVASPTLSRLAAEQRRLARERDEAARRAAAAKGDKPAKTNAKAAKKP